MKKDAALIIDKSNKHMNFCMNMVMIKSLKPIHRQMIHFPKNHLNDHIQNDQKM